MKKQSKSYLESVSNICCQCGYSFTYLDVVFAYWLEPNSKTITCPFCGVENVR